LGNGKAYRIDHHALFDGNQPGRFHRRFGMGIAGQDDQPLSMEKRAGSLKMPPGDEFVQLMLGGNTLNFQPFDHLDSLRLRKPGAQKVGQRLGTFVSENGKARRGPSIGQA